MKQSDVNHLRRLLGWIRCEIGQSPAELQQTMIEVADGLGHPEISQEAKARMVETYRRAEAAPLYVRAAVKALEKTLAARGREPGVEPARATAETRARIGFDPGADAGREPMDCPAPGQGGEAATHRAMSLGEILAEYRKGCGNTVGTGPEHCPECVAAFVLALEALDARQQSAPVAKAAKPSAVAFASAVLARYGHPPLPVVDPAPQAIEAQEQRRAGAVVLRIENPLDTAANWVACRDTPTAPPTLRRDDTGGAGAGRRDLAAWPTAQQLQKALADLVAECTRADAQAARELRRTFIYPNVLEGAKRVLAASLQADREAAGEAKNCRSTENPQAMQEGQP